MHNIKVQVYYCLLYTSATFIQNWQKEQKVTVTTANNQSTTYTIVLPKYDETLKDIIFIDDFNLESVAIDSRTPASERKELVDDFRRGKVKVPVSYTHLDVYKRQVLWKMISVNRLSRKEKQ